MKNEYFMIYKNVEGRSVLATDEEGPKKFRSEGQVSTEGRRLINAGTATSFTVLKAVAVHS